MLAAPVLFKLIHVMSAAVLFGCLVFGALVFSLASRMSRVSAPEVARVCVGGSYLTLAALIVQPVTGIVLLKLLDDSAMQPWLQATYVLFALVFCGWVAQTLLLRRIAAGAVHRSGLWALFAWGSVLLLCPIFYLMIAQPALWSRVG